MSNDFRVSRPRMPALDGAILDLHKHAVDLLKQVKPRGEVPKVHRATESAASYLLQAFLCDRPDYDLRRAREAMDRVIRALDALWDDDKINHDVHQDLRTRAEQIIAALHQLAGSPRAEWPDLPLPPRPPRQPRLWLLH